MSEFTTEDRARVCKALGWDQWHPIDTDPAWAARALADAWRLGYTDADIELPEEPDPDDPDASNFLVNLAKPGERCGAIGESASFALAVSLAVLAAVEERSRREAEGASDG